MASHPEIWSQVTAEVTDKDKAVTGKDKEVTVPALNSLTFLHCCLLETLRLYPPVLPPRTTARRVVLHVPDW